MGKEQNSSNGNISKAKKDIHKKSNDKKPFIFGAAILVLVLVLGYNFIGNSSKKANDTSSANTAANNTTSTTSSSGEGIKIVKKDITSTAKFYPYEASGIKMEVLAVKAKDGTVRTALNTCQVCYSSGKGYYKQEGDELVCQNCGNRFKIDMVGTAKNGCNPVPVPDKNKTDDGTNINISKDFLDKSKTMFAHWKS